MKLEVKKNKLATPFRKGEIVITPDGFSKAVDVGLTAISKGVIETSGSWYTYDGENMGQGKLAVIETIREASPEFKKKLNSEVKAACGGLK